MKQTRLLMLLYNQKGKGTYWRALGFAKSLTKFNYKITILIAAPKGESSFTTEMVNGIELVATPDLFSGTGYDLIAARKRVHWLKNRQFDLIHLFETRPVNLLPALYLKKKMNTPLIFDWCDWFGKGGSVEQRPNRIIRTLLRPIETHFEEKFRHHAAATTVINQTLFTKATTLNKQNTPISIIYNGVDLPHSLPDCLAARQKLKLSPNDHHLIYTGATFASDAHLMAESLNQLHKTLPNTRLILAGYYNFPIEPLLTHPKMVVRTGSLTRAQLIDYLAAADLGWLPLRNHGANQGRFPMKLMDFMATGKPIVSTDIGDLGRLIKEEKIGLTVNDNSMEIAQATETLLQDPCRRYEMGQQAMKIAQTKYSWSEITEPVHQLYQKVLHG